MKKGTVVILSIGAIVIGLLLGGIVYSIAPSVRTRVALGNGIRYLNELKYEEAKAQFTKALNIDPGNEDALKGLVSVYVAGAEEIVDSAKSTDNPDQYEVDEYNEAISVLSTGISEIKDIDGIKKNPAYDSGIEVIRNLITVYEKNRDSNLTASEPLPDTATEDAADMQNSDSDLTAVEEPASDAETEEVESPGERWDTVYGNTFYVPDGFANVTGEVFDGDRNAAGGYSSVFRNDAVGMEIQVDEFVWGNIAGFDATPDSFLYQDYSYYTGYPVLESQIYDDYFYYLREDEGSGKYIYVKEMINDTFCSMVTLTYPRGSSECEEIKDRFLETFYMSD